MTNVTQFPNPDEVLTEEEQEAAQYNADADRGYVLGVEFRQKAEELAQALNNAEHDGFWDGFYG